MLNAEKTPVWRAWLLLAVACWACLAPTAVAAFAPSFELRGPENRVWNFFPPSAETRQENEPQVADSHQGKVGCGYETASGVHDYLYANANPVKFADPSGRFGDVALQSLNAATTIVGILALLAVASMAVIYSPPIEFPPIDLSPPAIFREAARPVPDAIPRAVPIAKTSTKGGDCSAIIGENWRRIVHAKALVPKAEIFVWDEINGQLLYEGEEYGRSSFDVLESANFLWLTSVMSRGCHIYDIGFDLDRPGTPFFYLAELEWSRGYLNKSNLHFPGSGHLTP